MSLLLSKNYKIVEGTLTELQEFEELIADLLNEGYSTVGRPFVVTTATSYKIYQAMEIK